MVYTTYIIVNKEKSSGLKIVTLLNKKTVTILDINFLAVYNHIVIFRFNPSGNIVFKI
jgi:hypothetical protein